MGTPAQSLPLTYDQYLALERETGEKHCFLDGQVWAMSGGSITHGLLSGGVIGQLFVLARQCGCRVLTSDNKIRVKKTGFAGYPDVGVVCGPIVSDPEDRHAIINPSIIVEVLSPSTEAFDRGAKGRHWRSIESLRDLIIVYATEPLVEHYSRNEAGIWAYAEATTGESLQLTAFAGALSVDALYDGVLLDDGAP